MCLYKRSYLNYSKVLFFGCESLWFVECKLFTVNRYVSNWEKVFIYLGYKELLLFINLEFLEIKLFGIFGY